MAVEGSRAVDWRDASAYASLLRADRAVFAWEWLRRDAAYRAAATRAIAARRSANVTCAEIEAARPWGLHAFEHPDLGAPLARPLWRREIHPAVLMARAAASRCSQDAFEIERLGALARQVLRIGRAQHVLLSDGVHSIRLDVVGAPLDQGAVRLSYRLAGMAGAERPLLTLQRLLALYRTGRFAMCLHPRERRGRRWVMMLRVHDALAAGASQREIAALLIDARADEPGWRDVPGLRARVQRLVRGARTLGQDKYRYFLL